MRAERAPRSGAGESNGAIDVLRFGAALLVVVGHARALLVEDYARAQHGPVAVVFYTLTALGRPAVYVFFALSGYWVGGWVLRHVSNGTFSWVEHLLRRLSRLWTVLIPVLVVVVACDVVGRAFFGASPYYSGSTTFNGVAPVGSAHHLSVVDALGNAVFLQGHLTHTFGSDGPLWSLGYEFWYYLLFPLLLLLFALRRTRLAALFAALAIGCMLILGSNAVELFPAWLLGVGAYVVSHADQAWLTKLSKGRRGSVVLLTGCFVLATAAVVHVLNPPDAVAAFVDASAAAIYLIVAAKDVRPGLIGRATLATARRGAGMSYTLYAVHLPIALLLCAVINSGGAKRAVGFRTLSEMALVIGVCLLASHALAAVTERRTDVVREWLRRTLQLLPSKAQQVPEAQGVPSA